MAAQWLKINCVDAAPEVLRSSSVPYTEFQSLDGEHTHMHTHTHTLSLSIQHTVCETKALDHWQQRLNVKDIGSLLHLLAQNLGSTFQQYRIRIAHLLRCKVHTPRQSRLCQCTLASAQSCQGLHTRNLDVTNIQWLYEAYRVAHEGATACIFGCGNHLASVRTELFVVYSLACESVPICALAKPNNPMIV
jgi:hypothetical protein